MGEGVERFPGVDLRAAALRRVVRAVVSERSRGWGAVRRGVFGLARVERAVLGGVESAIAPSPPQKVTRGGRRDHHRAVILLASPLELTSGAARLRNRRMCAGGRLHESEARPVWAFSHLRRRGDGRRGRRRGRRRGPAPGQERGAGRRAPERAPGLGPGPGPSRWRHSPTGGWRRRSARKPSPLSAAASFRGGLQAGLFHKSSGARHRRRRRRDERRRECEASQGTLIATRAIIDAKSTRLAASKIDDAASNSGRRAVDHVASICKPARVPTPRRSERRYGAATRQLTAITNKKLYTRRHPRFATWFIRLFAPSGTSSSSPSSRE